MIITFKSLLFFKYGFFIKQTNMILRFITHFFVPLAFFCTLPSSIIYAHLFCLSATTPAKIFPPNLSLKTPGTFLFFTYWKRSFIIFIIVRCIKPYINIRSNLFKKIFNYNMNNKAICIRVT